MYDFSRTPYQSAILEGFFFDISALYMPDNSLGVHSKFNYMLTAFVALLLLYTMKVYYRYLPY